LKKQIVRKIVWIINAGILSSMQNLKEYGEISVGGGEVFNSVKKVSME